MEKGGEAAFDWGKSFIPCKLLAPMGFTFEPSLRGRILFWSMGSKTHAGDFPVGLGRVGILLHEKFLQFLPALVAGSIPEKGIVNLFALMQDQGEGAASHRFLALGGQGRSRDFLPDLKPVPQLWMVCGRGEPMLARPKVLCNGTVS